MRRCRRVRVVGGGSGLRLALGAAVLAGTFWGATGCTRTLFRESDVRTQYGRYDQARGQRAPMFVTDEFGAQKPNLRGRLGQTTTP